MRHFCCGLLLGGVAREACSIGTWCGPGNTAVTCIRARVIFAVGNATTVRRYTTANRIIKAGTRPATRRVVGIAIATSCCATLYAFGLGQLTRVIGPTSLIIRAPANAATATRRRRTVIRAIATTRVSEALV